jgi:hypothetical protein
MVEPTADPEVRDALTELELYLSDTLPPLVVAGSAELLLKYPPALVAARIRSWTGAQYGKGPEAAVSDYLFHAVKKIHMLGEFRLVPREVLGGYLEGLKVLVLADCPPEDQAVLAENLQRLSETTGGGSATASPVATLQRPHAASRGTAGAVAPTTAAASHERRLSLLLQRLESQVLAGGGGRGAPAGRSAIAETLAAAARESSSGQDIEGALSKLRGMGVEVGTADVFRALASSLPGWVVPPGAAWSGAAQAANPALDAMRRMVADAEDPLEGGKRFQELVRAAVERFNEGSLPQAVTTLEAAERLVADKKVDSGTLDLARRRADEGIDSERLRAVSENAAQHDFLRRFLSFFPALSPEGLLEQLTREEKRDRRRLLLALLEVHGASAREAAFRALAEPANDHAGADWFFRRNLLYILRKIPRPADAPVAEEAEVTARHADLKYPPPLLKEAIANLGQLKGEKSEAALTSLMADIEGALARPDAPYDAKEMTGLLDRIAGALARHGTNGARRALLAHAEKKDPRLGDSVGRLAELASQDLSEDGELVTRLLAELKSNLPFKLFGLALHQNDQIALHRISALSGTPSPAVRAAFEEIVSRFPDKEIARAAARALAAWKRGTTSAATAPAPGTAAPPAAPAAATLNGDLEIFGLPALLQSLSDSGASGSLTLRDPRGDVFGAIKLKGGKLRACQSGPLSGDDAFYQLLERPVPGVFQFVKMADAADETNTATLKEVLPLTLEAMRRHDELKQAAALVPDDVLLKPTDVRPAPFPGEKDGAMQKALWTRVSRGATPLACESEIKTDAYRIRRLLAHWVEQGSLAPEGP